MLREKLSNLQSSFGKAIVSYWRALLICPALFVYIFSNDIDIISLNSLIYRKLCLNEFNESVCDSVRNNTIVSNRLQEATSEKMIWLNVAFLIPAIFSIVRLASVADRKLNYEMPLVISLIGSLAQAFINIFAADQDYSLCFDLLIVSQLVNGILGGGSLAFISSCFSHVALFESAAPQQETSSQEASLSHNRRSIRYSILESCLLLGQFLGSFASGYIIGNKREIKKFRQTYIISFTLYFAVFIYIIVLFRYLHQNKKAIVQHISEEADINEVYVLTTPDEKFKWKHLYDFKRQFGFIGETWHLLSKRRDKNARFHLNSLLLLYFFGASISMGIMSPTQYLYLIKKPIALTQIQYGIFKALNTFFRAVSLLVILPVSKYFFAVSDSVLFFAGLISELLNLVVFAAASASSSIIWLGIAKKKTKHQMELGFNFSSFLFHRPGSLHVFKLLCCMH
jgi:hypothetical protein